MANFYRKFDLSIYLAMVLYTFLDIIILALFFFFIGNVTKILPHVTYSLCFMRFFNHKRRDKTKLTQQRLSHEYSRCLWLQFSFSWSPLLCHSTISIIWFVS